MGGKGIIDINLGVIKSKIKSAIKKLIKNKYSFFEDGGDKKERWFFERDFVHKGKIYRVHVHLTILNSYTWKKCILFREVLKNSKELREKYSKIKKEAISKKLRNDAYRDYKKKFIESIEKRGDN